MASIEIIPRVLQLVVGVLGLIFSIRGRARGVSGLMAGAFAVMLITTTASIVWQFVSLNAASWSSSNHLDLDEIQLIFLAVGLPLDAASVLSWLLVAIAVAKGGRPARHPGFAPYPGPGGYPMAAQPGFVGPQPGYGQAGPPQQPPH
ncbi:hypothetical protein [Amycolatopsis sp. CA-128772]|uniref:hypothetical protein n=1 Tax=Amycolatopsis sp. CA-128772 TaxID=2073159 RepID=UPI001E406C57|nr:hypothetical protein [Amycolatopsis sp. CA-128772]